VIAPDVDITDAPAQMVVGDTFSNLAATAGGTVTWSVTPGTGTASISGGDDLTANTVGTITIQAAYDDGNSMATDTQECTIIATGNAPDQPTGAKVVEDYANAENIINASNVEYVTVEVTLDGTTDAYCPKTHPRQKPGMDRSARSDAAVRLAANGVNCAPEWAERTFGPYRSGA